MATPTVLSLRGCFVISSFRGCFVVSSLRGCFVFHLSDLSGDAVPCIQIVQQEQYLCRLVRSLALLHVSIRAYE